jgi:HlyD family secretion protein
MKRIIVMLRKLVLILLFLGLLSGAAWGVWQWQNGGSTGPQFRTEPVKRGKLVATITATGTLVPEEVVDVGAQVAGQILRFGSDPNSGTKTIDYRSRVEQGTILAQIDDSLYKSDVDTAKADLAVAQAQVQQSEADLLQMRSKLEQTERDWERAKRLGPGGSLAQADVDLAKNAYVSAKAAVPGGEAAVVKAKKSVERAKAVLERAQKNLDYCTIRSPVKGEIIDRRVNVGQTVVSSLNAPSLFLIAKDLTHMQIWASVNEADIGSIHPGQTAEFTVDAFPREVFHGTVYQIRYNANNTQNVVTYTVVVNTDNKDLKLLPYLTANVRFKVDERSDALLVPNAALRWRPKPELIDPEYRAEFEQAQRRKEASSTTRLSNRATIWVQENGFVKPIKIRMGVTDGAMTEVIEAPGELAPDTPVVTGVIESQAIGSNNPFAPKMFGGGKKGP